MKYNHELIVPDEGLPFKMFIFEGKDGNYKREMHWHRSVEIFAVCEGELCFYIKEKPYPSCAGRIYDREFQRSSFRAFSKAEPDDCIADTDPVV